MTTIGSSLRTSTNFPAAVETSLVVLALWLLQSVAWAETAATVAQLRGTLSVRRADGSEGLLALHSQVREGDTLNTEANTYARLKFTDNAETVLRPGSELAVERYRYAADKPESGSAWLRLLKGGLRRITGLIGKTASRNEVLNTPVATVGIRGTHYGVLFCRGDCGQIPTVTGEPPLDGLHVDVAAGRIAVKNRVGEIVVGPGQFAYVRDGDTPPVLVPASEGIQVTIPPATALSTVKETTADEDDGNDQCSIR
jgi:hypothetical protein